MTGKRFDEIVDALAKKNAKAVVDRFVSAVKDALVEVDHTLLYETNLWSKSLVVSLLSQLTINPNFRVWPETIFDKEREKVRKELLATLDIMQRAVIAADNVQPDINFGETKTSKE